MNNFGKQELCDSKNVINDFKSEKKSLNIVEAIGQCDDILYTCRQVLIDLNGLQGEGFFKEEDIPAAEVLVLEGFKTVKNYLASIKTPEQLRITK